MKRIIRNMTYLIICTFLLTACEAKKNDYVNVAETPFASATAVALPATIAYAPKNTDSSLDEKKIKPNSVFVQVNDKLQVSGRSDSAVFSSLQEFLPAMNDLILGLYIKTDVAAEALLAYLKSAGRQDVIVAASAQNAPLIQKIKKELPAIRGLIDFSDMEHSLTREELGHVVAATNAGGAKIALLSYPAATRETIKYLQSRLITVWVCVNDDKMEILTQLTNGVNGLMTEHYESVYDALALFEANIPILLRTPMIIGHRGLPSEYIENTLRSEKAAANAGADLLEYDIYLSSDEEIFVLHDNTMKRLFNRPDISNVESMTLAQLQAVSFDSDSDNGVQKRNHTTKKDSTNGTISVSSEDRIPALRDLFEEFKNTDIIHLIEIKSLNVNIVKKLKSLAEECGVVDQMVVISFNVPILRAMAETWPEMSLGCLGYDDAKARNLKNGKPFDPEKEVPYDNHTKMVNDAGGDTKSSVSALNSVVGFYNGTYNPSNASLSYPMITAGRHYGITVWPWTYNTTALFAQDYLFGMYGLTTNFASWAAGFPESFTASDGELSKGRTLQLSEVLSPAIKTHNGEYYSCETIEPVIVHGQDLIKVDSGMITALSQGTCILLLRTRIPLRIADKDYGAYYIYSNPVNLTIKP